MTIDNCGIACGDGLERGASVNLILEKSKRFAVRIVRLSQYLQREKQEYVLSKQLLRSGTGIGANIREGTQAASRPDFVNKLSIALKESVETEFHSIYADNQEVTRLLTAIINTSKRNNQNTE